MRIESIQVWNKFYEWECDKIDFNSNLTLLVGTSGVGKTQILEAIRTLQEVANGKSRNGFQWDVDFTSNSGKTFRWKGAFEMEEDPRSPLTKFAFTEDHDRENKSHPHIKAELLQCDGFTIIDRNGNDLIFGGTRMPKLSPVQSAIFILKEEEIIKDVFNSFRRILYKDLTRQEKDFTVTHEQLSELKVKYPTFQELRNSDEWLKTKVLVSAELSLPIFYEIKDRFISIFPQVEDMRIEQLDLKDEPASIADWTMPMFSIKEKGVQKWIVENHISSGMLRTLNHICELYLANEGTVILLDEFENSLGTNCIDILTEDLVHENSGIQFIATSHHPYIINNIPYEYWKIVTRVGGHIVVKDATDYSLGDSKQDAFIRLTRVLESQYEQ